MSMPTSLPPAGFYWARLSRTPRHWQPVEVVSDGRLFVRPLRGERLGAVIEWGPELDPPGVAKRLTLVEAARIQRCIFVAEGEGAIEDSEKKELMALLVRVTTP